MDFESMTNEELKSKLIEAGISVGPIVETTRPVYIRRLRRLNGELEEVINTPDNDESEDEEEPPARPSPVRRERPMTAKTTRTPPTAAGDIGEVRQRVVQKKLNVPITKEIEEAPRGGGVGSYIVKFLIFLVLCVVIFYVIGLMSDGGPINLISGST